MHPLPDISLVMPCYNEEECLCETAGGLLRAFDRAGIDLELVLVDNGSTDATGDVIDRLVAQGFPVVKETVTRNIGYGHGILRGLDRCRAPIIGYLCADGQVTPVDVVRTYHLMTGREERVLAKVRRRFRQDSWKRKIVSIIYNFSMVGFFGWLGAIDINGSPKIFSRRNYQRMKLTSRDWFLDPEIVLKARALGLRMIEIDVEGFARQGGTSNVKPQTILEFLKNIWRYRLGGPLREWRRSVSPSANAPDDDEPDAETSLLDRVRVVTQRRHEDYRGFVQKVLTASQCGGRPPRGEVYVTSAHPGEVKGNHLHRQMGEWFAVVQGEGSLEICHPDTGERRAVTVSAANACAVYVPAGAAHAIVNRGDDVMICVAWAEAEHDPRDVFAYPVWPPGRPATVQAAPV